MATRSYSELVKRVEELVSIEHYVSLGVLKGGLLLAAAFREGALNLYALDPSTGSMKRLNRDPVTLTARHEYGSDRVVFARDVARGAEMHALYSVSLDSPGEEERLAPSMKPARVLGIVYSGGEVLFTASTREENGLYAVEGDSARLVARFKGVPLLTSYGRGLAAGVTMKPEWGGRFGLFVADAGSGEVKEHLPEGGSACCPVVAGDGTVIYAFIGPRRAELRRLEPSGMKDEKLRLEGRDLDSFEPTDITFIDVAPDGSIIVIARKAGRSRLFIDGRLVRAPEGSLYYAQLRGGRIYVTHSSLRKPPRILEIGGDGGVRVVAEGRLPGWLGEALREVSFVEVESFDGSRVPTYVLKSGEAGEPGPTVVLVHGGPFAEYGDDWNLLAASLASAGFHVVMPNYRGSVGYGEEWKLKIIGDPCGGELEDIVASARWARSSGLASRVYIAGYSYGGYMTMCALTRKPREFEGGVAGASVVDWVEMYELSDAAFKQFIEFLFGGKRDAELWRERSPISYVDSLEKPLCIVHPQNDSRTPLKPVLRFMEKALERGKAFEAHIAPDMGHVVNTVEDAMKIVVPAVVFLARLEKRVGGSAQSD